MAPLCLTAKSTVRPTVSVNGSRLRPVLSAPARFTPKRDLIKRYSSDSGEKNDDKLVSDSGEVLQGRYVSNARADTLQRAACTAAAAVHCNPCCSRSTRVPG